ncbi:hypothetical protein P7K49_025405 [Saguinus oedipus]|uniref:Uncharacterized protein n=1 Tax=Saguinus oedipus TaxID=9490 RepID=A0ABQ9UH43_SAGOE|nr:hypothetical protein P7K49_025405 [Saguinus oedipus]
MSKMPPAPSGPKASPMPISTELPPQKTAVSPQVKLAKKEEQEVKTEAEKVILEKVKETISMENVPPMVTTDQKQEESKLEKDRASALQEKKPLPEEKKLIPKEEKVCPEEKRPLLEETKPTPEDKKLLPETKTSAPEEQKHDLLKSQVQIAEEKLEGGVAPKTVQEEKQPQTKMEDLPSGTPQSLPKEDDKTIKTIKEQPQPPCPAKPDQVEPGKEKTPSFEELQNIQKILFAFSTEGIFEKSKTKFASVDVSPLLVKASSYTTMRRDLNGTPFLTASH